MKYSSQYVLKELFETEQVRMLNRLKGPSQKEAMHFYAPMRITKIKHIFT